MPIASCIYFASPIPATYNSMMLACNRQPGAVHSPSFHATSYTLRFVQPVENIHMSYIIQCRYMLSFLYFIVYMYIEDTHTHTHIYIYIYMLAPPPMIHRSVVRGVVEGEQDLSGMHAISTPSTFYSAYSFRSISFQSSRERTKTRFIQRYIW